MGANPDQSRYTQVLWEAYPVAGQGVSPAFYIGGQLWLIPVNVTRERNVSLKNT